MLAPALVKSGEVGTAPVFTDHTMLALVAPPAHVLADVNPPKATSGVKNAPPVGSVTLIEVSGPLDALPAVTSAVLELPAAIVDGVNVFVADTAEFSPVTV